ncbi:MAG: hypothetical protein K8R54_03145 [Bacteroidales bacterium]|nr:hypothetical protein [Bacteroidales bacterium]
MIIRWKYIYETGIFVIDYRNKKLVSLINEFYKYIFTEDIIDHAERIVNKMIIELITHFSVEKKLLKDYNYTPESIDKHIEEHDYFIEKLENALKRIESGDIIVCYKLADFLG